MPVLKDLRLVGVISDRDIKEASFFQGPGELLTEEIMSYDLVCAPPDSLLTDIVYAMLLKKINAVPIVDKDGELVGIFTSYDLMRLVLDHAIAREDVEEFHLPAALPFPEGQSLQWKKGKSCEVNEPEPPYPTGA